MRFHRQPIALSVPRLTSSRRSQSKSLFDAVYNHGIRCPANADLGLVRLLEHSKRCLSTDEMIMHQSNCLYYASSDGAEGSS